MTFHKSNLANIKRRFMAETGVVLPRKRHFRWSVAVLAAALLCCVGFGIAKFSSLAGDDLALSAVYQGNGKAQITVENRGKRTLLLDECKLMHWQTGAKLCDVSLERTPIAPGERKTLAVSFSSDVTAEGAYFLLTNNGFAFGQDWICSVPSANSASQVETQTVYTPNVSDVEAELRDYFAQVTPDAVVRNGLTEQYMADVAVLLNGMELAVPCNPRISLGENRRMSWHWTSIDYNWKLVGRNFEEKVLRVDILVPSRQYADTFVPVPCRYLVCYEKTAIGSAFLHGQVLEFSELESCLVYEDDMYRCYDISKLIFGEDNWLAIAMGQNGDIAPDDISNELAEHCLDGITITE